MGKKKRSGVEEEFLRRIRFISARALCTLSARQSSTGAVAQISTNTTKDMAQRSVQSLSNARGQILLVLRYAGCVFKLPALDSARPESPYCSYRDREDGNPDDIPRPFRLNTVAELFYAVG